jgi:TonB family protein
MIRKLSVAILSLAMLAPLSAQGPYRVGGGVTAPKPITKVEASYTPEAKQARIEGSVLLKVVIDRTGVPHDIEVVRPLDSGLDANAVTAVSQWRFDPGRKDGLAVDVIASIEINFRLL